MWRHLLELEMQFVVFGLQRLVLLFDLLQLLTPFLLNGELVEFHLLELLEKNCSHVLVAFARLFFLPL